MADFRVTTGVAQVLALLLENPRTGWYGLELMKATGQPSGTLYPILTRLLQAGWVRADWEDIDPAESGRPARRYYRLTAEGATAAQAELAALQARLQPRGATPPRAAGSFSLGWANP